MFLKKNRTFTCRALGNARITPEQCVDRQLREVETKYFGRKITVNNTIFDKWCRSGCCEVGLKHLRDLRPDVVKIRLKVRKETKNPCKPLGGGVCA